MGSGRPPTPDELRSELEAIPREDRLEFLANLPRDQQVAFKRILPPDAIEKLIAHLNRRVQRSKVLSPEQWLTEARAGRAASPDAMIEVLQASDTKLLPKDAMWIKRIADTASAGAFSRKQKEVIRSIYERYFRSPGRP